MCIRILTTAAMFLCSRHVYGQEPPPHPPIVTPPNRAIAKMIRVSPWPHIGSPPSDLAPTGRADQWARENATFKEAFDTVKESWPRDAISSAYELRSKVSEYESFIRVVTESPGYGNLVLAHCLRRLDQVLLMQYIVAYPSEHAVVGEILNEDRVKLLNSQVTRGMLSEEVKVVPASGEWRLSERREDWDLVFHSFGSSFRDETGSVLFGTPAISRLMTRRDVNGLLVRLLSSETVERVSLPGLVEFLKQGGKLDDLLTGSAEPFLRVMEKQRAKFQFPVMGISMLGSELLGEVVESFRPHIRRPIPFAAAIQE